jgi:hypothetical protein
VQEYLVVLLEEREVRWLRRVAGTFEPLDQQGVVRSITFPGLVLNTPALLCGNLAQVLAALELGIQSPEHGEFVMQLERRRAANMIHATK